MVEPSGPSRVPSPRFRNWEVVPSGLWTKGGPSAARSCVPPTEFEEPPPVEETGEQEFFLPFAVTDRIQELFLRERGEKWGL